jgi:hypothetical protein
VRSSDRPAQGGGLSASESLLSVIVKLMELGRLLLELIRPVPFVGYLQVRIIAEAILVVRYRENAVCG